MDVQVSNKNHILVIDTSNDGELTATKPSNTTSTVSSSLNSPLNSQIENYIDEPPHS